jgi:preprotein translocase subunit SecE
MATRTVERPGRQAGGIARFAQEAVQELSKVTWPTRETVIRFTVLVLIISAVIAAYIFAVDNFFTATITRGILGTPETTVP